MSLSVSISAFETYRFQTAAQVSASRDGAAAGVTSSVTSTAALTVTLSPNASRLVRAEANLDALQSSGALKGVWNDDVRQSLIGLNTEPGADKQIENLPKDDSEHLEQARAAQSFVKAKISSAGAPVSASNPFQGYSYQALAAIVTDKAGLYTDYEKSAAFYAFNDKQNEWVQPLAEQGQRSGDFSLFYREAATQFSALPPVIQATYPAGYLDQIRSFVANGSTSSSAAEAIPSDEGVESPILKIFRDFSGFLSSWHDLANAQHQRIDE